MRRALEVGLRFGMIATVVLAAAGAARAQGNRQDNLQPVIVTYRQQPGAADEAFLRAAGGAVRHRFHIVPAIAARLPQHVVEMLQANPSVTAVDPDVEIHATDEYTSVWGVVKVGAKVVHGTNVKGAGVKVCVIDSGIDYLHSELAANYLGGYDFVNRDADPMDDNGHGTHVAGTVAAALNTANIAGVAPSVQILAYKILDRSGNGSFSDAIAALERCQADGGKVTNNSYGSSSDPGATAQAAYDNTYSAGILHVASAGNTGSGADTVSYPGKFTSVIAVAATDQSNTRAYFSSTGPAVELSAPGVAIYSTYPGNGYASMSGTSVASPHVAGVAALLFGCSSTTNTAVRGRLTSTAQQLGVATRDDVYGYGLVRADLAVTNCQTPPPPPTVPAAPTGLAAYASGRAVQLTWTDNSANEDNFIVERCKVGKNSCSMSVIATLPANTSNIVGYLDTSVARRTTYRYRVTARNAGGDAPSNIAQVKSN